MSCNQFHHVDGQIVSICGSQWGDEGKGKFCGFFSKNFDCIARFNGGANAGHTLVHDGKVYKFRMLPCGVIYEHVKCIIGTGCVVSLEMLYHDIQNTPYDQQSIINRLYISNRAHLVLPLHQKLDVEMEKAMSGISGQIGTTKSGIGPTYSTKMLRTGIRMADLVDFENFKKQFRNLILLNRGGLFSEDEIKLQLEKYEKFHRIFKNCIINTNLLIFKEIKLGKRFLIECANGALLDIDYGTYPFVTSSNTITPAIGAHLGIPIKFPVVNIGITKAYQTRVGEGPFPTELTDSFGLKLRSQGNEFGSNTDRPRRCGWIDIPALRHSHNVCVYDYLVLTKLDVLTGFEKIEICVDYKINGVLMEHGDYPACVKDFSLIEPVYENAQTWDEDISQCKKFSDLPINAQKYVKRIEQLVGIPIKWIGVGRDNDSTIPLD